MIGYISKYLKVLAGDEDSGEKLPNGSAYIY